MLRGLIISTDQELAERAANSLGEVGNVSIVRYIDHYPSSDELGPIVRAVAPDIAFISIEKMDEVAKVIAILEALAPGIQYVALSRECDPQMLLDTMRSGMREFLSAPFNRQSVFEAMARVADSIEKRPPQIRTTKDIYSFLPAKAGVGASTLALNSAVAMSRVPDTNVCLSDFDMNSGMMRFMLKLTNEFSVADACEHSGSMDESLWPQLITRFHTLDVLHAGKLNPNLRIEGMQIRNLVDFLRRNYRGLVFDLSGNLERYSFEIMHESKRIFLVCTPEIPALHLAREKFAFLRSLDLQDRVSVLVNRCQKRQLISNDQIEQILGLPVQMVFPNDYQSVHKALTIGRSVEFHTELGKAVNAFASRLIEQRVAGQSGQYQVVQPKRTFLDFLTGAKAS